MKKAHVRALTLKLKTVLEPYSYLAANPGKDMRAQLIDAFNVWLQVPTEFIEVVKQVVGQLHTASLLYVLPFQT